VFRAWLPNLGQNVFKITSKPYLQVTEIEKKNYDATFTVGKRLTLSTKYTSQALYRTLQTTKMNFEKLLG